MRHTANDEDEDFDPADEVSSSSESEDEDHQDEEQSESEVQVQQRRGRGRSKMPETRYVITAVSRAGNPFQPKEAARQFRTACGVLAKERVSINLASWKKLGESEKDLLWNDLLEKFEIPEEYEAIVRVRALKSMAQAFRAFKHKLTKYYALIGQAPFEDYPFIHKQGWEIFVESRLTEEFAKISQTHKEIQSHNTNPHRLGTGGYDGKAEEWERIDEQARREGRELPFSEVDSEVCRTWLRGRSSKTADGQLVLNNPRDQEVAQEMIRLTVESSQGSIRLARENDVLSKALGRPEHPGRTRGVSVYATWKQGLHDDGSYRSRQRKKEARESEMIEAVRAEFRQHILTLEERIDRLNQPQEGAPNQLGPNPPLRSSYASAQANIHYPIDEIQVPTPCTLQVTVNDEPMDAAKGMAYPCAEGDVIHGLPILSGNAKVSVDWVEPFLKNVTLKCPVDDEVRTLGQAVRHFIQWPKSAISLDQPAAQASASPVLQELNQISSPVVATQAPLLKKRMQSFSEASISSPVKPSKKMKAKENNKENKNAQPQVYPFKLGSPFGNEAYVKSLTGACQILHRWYLKRSTERKDMPQSITGFIPNEVLLSGGNYFAITFDDLHLLYQYKELDSQLLRVWTLYMIEEARLGPQRLGFLDPACICESDLVSNMQGAVDYIFSVLAANRGKDYVVGAYNSLSKWHWILVVIDLSTNSVIYMDSRNHPQDSYNPITSAIDRAWEMFVQLEGMSKRASGKLYHCFNFPCNRQPTGTNLCGFYACWYMQSLVSTLPVKILGENDVPQWHIPTTPLQEKDFQSIRGQLCNFINREILKKDGKYYVAACDM
ncbi:hypothetical protein ACP70R_014513 [Stipagrostis hirtigluma subsp. patula]